jgi:putative transposase
MRPRDFMLSGDVEPRPIALWQWGIIHRSGHLRTFDRQKTRVNLLPTERGTVTEKGIRFRKLYFTCERAVTEQWFTKARATRTWPVEVGYDPRSVSVTYLRGPDGKTVEQCRLMDAYASFQNCTWHEIDDFFAAGRKQAFDTRGGDIQYDSEYHTLRANLVAEAVKKTESAQTGGTGPSLNGIRENRDSEKDHERKSAGASAKSEMPPANIIPISDTPNDNNDDYVAAVCDYDLLKQQRDEVLNNK